MIFQYRCFEAGIPESGYQNTFPVMLNGSAKELFHHYIGTTYDINGMINIMKQEFETEERRERKTTKWNNTYLEHYIDKHPDKSITKYFNIMKDKLIGLQLALRLGQQNDLTFRDRIYDAIKYIPECDFASYNRKDTSQKAIEDIRYALAISAFRTPSTSTSSNYRVEQGYSQVPPQSPSLPPSNKRCICCRRRGCHSSLHPADEQLRALDRLQDGRG